MDGAEKSRLVRIVAMMQISALIFSVLRSTEARPMASSPMRLPINPPPITRRSASFHSLSFRKRRMMTASSCAKDSIALWNDTGRLGIAA